MMKEIIENLIKEAVMNESPKGSFTVKDLAMHNANGATRRKLGYRTDANKEKWNATAEVGASTFREGWIFALEQLKKRLQIID